MKTDKHQQLLSEKGGGGFPYLAFLDASGNLLAKHDYSDPMDASGFAITHGKAKKFVDLRTKAEAGDKAAKVEYFLAAVELGHFALADAQKRARELEGLTDDQKKKIDAALASLEMNEVMSTVTRDKETQIAAGKKCLEMKKAGRVPADEQQMANFYSMILEYAESAKDVAAFEEALGILKDKFGNNPRAKGYLAGKEKILEQMKSEKK